MSIASRFASVRLHTLALAEPLSAEDCMAQSMPDASPVKWHLAHTTWFFETFILENFEPGFEPFHQDFRFLFNSYYNGIGARHPRAQRGLLSRPSLADVQAYRNNVDERVLRLLAQRPQEGKLVELVTLGLHHEQQHQELIRSTVLTLPGQTPPSDRPVGWASTAV
jgi:hypothetical protein